MENDNEQDIIGEAINELKSRTLNQVKEIYAMTKDSSRKSLAFDLGHIIAEGRDEMLDLKINDPRVGEALGELEDIFVQMARGEYTLSDEEVEEMKYKRAMRRIETLMDEIERAESELDQLSAFAEEYESRHFPIEKPSPFERVKFRLEQWFGRKSRE